MSYIDKNIALKYLANSEKIYDKIKNKFLDDYKDIVVDLEKISSTNQIEEIYRYIHSLKGVSLYIGSQVLYDDCTVFLDKIKMEGTNIPSLEQIINTMKNVYFELENN